MICRIKLLDHLSIRCDAIHSHLLKFKSYQYRINNLCTVAVAAKSSRTNKSESSILHLCMLDNNFNNNECTITEMAYIFQGL